MHKKIIHLDPPHISANHIKEKISCIRAHRERLFRVEIEQRDNQLICHNYGQGGAGFTFLFGCTAQSMAQFQQAVEIKPSLKKEPIAVIGAGVYGLLTAIELARHGYRPTIIAKQFDDLPSDKAAGFFFPRPRKSSTPAEREIFISYGLHSYRTYAQIAQGTHPFLSVGARMIDSYFSPEIDPGFSPLLEAKLMPSPKQVIIDFGSAKQYPAIAYQQLFIQTKPLMAQLRQLISAYGISMTQADVARFDELPHAIVFNCSGYGAKKLAADARIVPVQGHLISLRNQSPIPNYLLNVTTLMTDLRGRPRNELIYYAPKDEGILGITFIRGQESIDANSHEFERLLERCSHFFGG